MKKNNVCCVINEDTDNADNNNEYVLIVKETTILMNKVVMDPDIDVTIEGILDEEEQDWETEIEECFVAFVTGCEVVMSEETWINLVKDDKLCELMRSVNGAASGNNCYVAREAGEVCQGQHRGEAREDEPKRALRS
ncbi:hypothetical protein NDU88_013235 [Pleurodeles waltl]|uniref:Uncharacterized protein n=1 Tax=Pleurodeles waltl TaxID=8319 RepID=A0AAV7R2H3_PLEWA|nr:hypothetical protein NDU88_013235 [Pleurodeles waltl]